jgi:putative ABC transport system permease protein
MAMATTTSTNHDPVFSWKQVRKLAFLLWTVSLRFSWSHRVLTLFTVAGIALGVGVFFSIQLTNQSVLQAFTHGVNALADDHVLEITRRDGQPLEEAKLPTIQPALWAIGGEAIPVSEAVALLQLKRREKAVNVSPEAKQARLTPTPDVLRLYGTNLLTRQSQEHPWSSQLTNDPFAIFQPNAVYITQSLAQRYGLTLHSAMPLLVNDQLKTVRVVGILSGNTSRVTDQQLVLMDIGPYQQLTHQTGRVDRLHIVSQLPVKALKQPLQTTLPAGWEANPPQRRAERAQQLVMAFQQNLQALGFVALLVGLFLVYNTMTIFVVQRHLLLATLRALGLSKGLTACLILLEAAILGLTGSLVGMGLGWGLSQASLSGVSTTIQMVYAGQAVTHVLLSPLNLLGVLCLGTLLTVLASLPACWQAMAIPPADTLRPARQGVSADQSPWPRRLLGIGLVLCASAIGLASLPPVGVGFPLFGYLATFALFLGLAACVPVIVRYGVRVSAFHLPVMVAAGLGHCQRAWAKTSVAMASLMVGIALMLSMAVLIGSFRQSVVDWVQNTLRADVLIEPRIRSARKGVGIIQPQTVAAIRQLPQVADVDAFAQQEIVIGPRQSVYVATGNLPALYKHGQLDILDGLPHKRAIAGLIQYQAKPTEAVPVLISEPFAVKKQLAVGQSFQLPGMASRFNVVSIYRDFSSEQGYVILPSEVFKQYVRKPGIASLAVYLKPGVQASAFRQAVASQLSASNWAGLQLRTNQELRRDVLVIFDNTFSVTYALFAIALVVSALCVLITLLTLVLESTTELTLLRFLGATRGHITQWVLTQAAILALVGYGLGIVAGMGLAAILVFVINKQSFGWSVTFIPPTAMFLLVTGLSMLGLALLAGYAPARWIQRRLQPDVLRYV